MAGRKNAFPVGPMQEGRVRRPLALIHMRMAHLHCWQPDSRLSWRRCGQIVWIDQRGSEILTAPECLRLVALAAKEDHIGRLAMTEEHSPLVIPLNCKYKDKGILLRLGPGRLSEVVPGSIV